ncbi:hypothetical protein MMC13_005868 [Lambiella insularis]|nr:hypothetical protein [Lambiella insularis]
MSTPAAQPLRWSTQLKVLKAATTPKLHGDKVTLPPSALEQLLSAASVLVPLDSPPSASSTFDPFNPYSYDTERQARSQAYETRQQLPQPLTFRIVNPQNGNIVYAGVREFSAGEGHVGLSPFLREALGLEDKDDIHSPSPGTGLEDFPTITLHAQQLPKGTFVRMRPLESGYDPEDWKALLERYMRDTFTTLTTGEILSIPSGKENYRFLVDKMIPEGDAITIVDTDLEVEIEALNEEQARETLKRRLEKNQRGPPGTKNGSSDGGALAPGKEEYGQVLPGAYVDYTVKTWDRSQSIQIELQSVDSDGLVDIFVSPFSATQRVRPRDDIHVFGDLSEQLNKRVQIQNRSAELDGAESIWISVRGYESDVDRSNVQAAPRVPLPYSLRLSAQDSASVHNAPVPDDTITNLDDLQCKNCFQWVPKRSVKIHEIFCYRNNVLCPKCKEVFKKSSNEWKNHWHCAHDNAYGNTAEVHYKHDSIFHTQQVCTSCGHEASSIPQLAHHRTTICPGKIILCKFCHLQVPQQGPDDPSPTDPEVIFSGLTPHELADGARTTECHMCGKIIRLRDMTTHLKHHDLERLSRITPRICRNVNCGRTLDGVGPNGDVRRPRANNNDISLCDPCYGPLYNNAYDPDGKALKRRVERRILTQLLTGCGKAWCSNSYCRTGRMHLELDEAGTPVTSRDAMVMIKPLLEHLNDGRSSLYFCTDESSQKRRVLAEIIASEGYPTTGYDLSWCIAALEAEGGNMDKARTWLANWAPTRAETSR